MRRYLPVLTFSLFALSFAIMFGENWGIFLVLTYLVLQPLTNETEEIYNQTMDEPTPIPDLTPRPDDAPAVAAQPTPPLVTAPDPAPAKPEPQTIVVKKPVKFSGQLSSDDWKKWRKEFVIYFIFPVLSVLLIQLKGAFAITHHLPTVNDLVGVLPAVYIAGLNMLINLLGKYQQGI